ncbi:MAG: MFS transporter [Chloroflexi bacterium]|nr:MFS transporter [Chloroflexota bacterium]
MPASRVVAETDSETALGWSRSLIVGGTLVALMSANAGVRGAFSNFFIPLLEQLGTSRTSLSASFTVSRVVLGVVQPFLGKVLDRHGPAAVIVPSTIALAAGFLLLPFSSQLWHVYALYGVLMAVGLAGTSSSIGFPIAVQWFRKQRSLILGILGAAGMLGTLAIVPGSMFLLLNLGWPQTCVLLAIASVLVALPVMIGFLPKARPTEAARLVRPGTGSIAEPGSATGVTRAPVSQLGISQLLQNRTFWLLVVPTCASGTSGTLVQVHFVPLMLDQGQSPQVAANALGVIAAIGIAGVLAGGVFAYRLGEKNILTSLYLLRGAGMLLLPFAGGTVALYLSVLLVGLSWGGVQPMTGGVVGDSFDRGAMGTVIGWIFSIQNVVGALGAILGGAAHDWTGHYDVAFYLSGAFLFVGATLTFMIRTRPPAGVN